MISKKLSPNTKTRWTRSVSTKPLTQSWQSIDKWYGVAYEDIVRNQWFLPNAFILSANHALINAWKWNNESVQIAWRSLVQKTYERFGGNN